MSRFPTRPTLLVLPALIAGCARQPLLTTPAPVTATRWTTPGVAAEPNRQPLAALLGSPQLADLIARARAQSPTLLAATARIDQTRARLRIARGAGLPTLSVGARVAARRAELGGAFDFASNFAAIDAGLAIDLGGGVAAGRRSAGDRARAAVFDRRALDIAVTTDVTRSFIARAALHGRIALIDRSIGRAAELERILALRAREGVATRADVGLQAIRVEQLRADRDRLQQALEESRVTLAILIGDEAPSFASVPADLDAFAIPTIGLPAPAQLIALRPDVRAAEARIAAAGGDVAQARAAFLPRLDVSAGRSARGLLTGGPLAGISIAADLIAPIFARARLKGQLAEASAVQRETAQAYRTVLLGALGSAENALAAAGHARARAIILTRLNAEAQRTVDLARLQYLEGDADLRHLLDAQDLLIAAQDAQLVNRQEQLEAAILLFQASSA